MDSIAISANFGAHACEGIMRVIISTPAKRLILRCLDAFSIPVIMLIAASHIEDITLEEYHDREQVMSDDSNREDDGELNASPDTYSVVSSDSTPLAWYDVETQVLSSARRLDLTAGPDTLDSFLQTIEAPNVSRLCVTVPMPRAPGSTYVERGGGESDIEHWRRTSPIVTLGVAGWSMPKLQDLSIVTEGTPYERLDLGEALVDLAKATRQLTRFCFDDTADHALFSIQDINEAATIWGSCRLDLGILPTRSAKPSWRYIRS